MGIGASHKAYCFEWNPVFSEGLPVLFTLSIHIEPRLLRQTYKFPIMPDISIYTPFNRDLSAYLKP